MTPVKKRAPPSASEPSRAAERQRRQFEERDRLIREAAQRLLLERGLHGFSMEDVADAIEYSKGTVYLHYTSKEDALAASCADRVGQLAGRLERAASYPGTTRERMTAITETHGRFVRENPVNFRTLPLMHSPTVLEKAAPMRRQAIDAGIERTVAACTGVVRDAVTRGDLALPARTRPEDVSFALFALMFGSHMLADLHAPEGLLGVTDPAAAVRLHWETYMDGLGWKPVVGKEEAEASYRRIRDTLFPTPDRRAVE
jgi:AcrR family transcriptional regulator